MSSSSSCCCASAAACKAEEKKCEAKCCKAAMPLVTVQCVPAGQTILTNPRLNKDLAFTPCERKALGLQGLLPEVYLTQEQQAAEVMKNLKNCQRPIDKYIDLIDLADRNEHLFYKTALMNIEELMPIVYTPVVGQACQEFGHVWRRPRGLYVSLKHKGKIRQLLDEWNQPNVRAIVFTDGERILGLGDQGTCGMGIPIGKLMLYTICGGVHPDECLPVTLDVGTNNATHRADPYYTGLKQDRLRGAEYDAFVKEFMDAAADKWGKTCLLQFEDFGNLNAFRLLENSIDKYCTFNDDIQGTACVIVGGLIASEKLTNTKLKDRVFVFMGAGEAGIGIAQLICHAIMAEDKVDFKEAKKNIFMVDSKGLVVNSRTDLTHEKKLFSQDFKQIKELKDIVRETKCTALIGVCAMPGVFTEEICKQMAVNHHDPIIFALSNPTSKAEVSAKLAYEWTEGRAVYASGSPFPNHTMEVMEGKEKKTKTYYPGQGNNAYIFPGVAFGVLCCGSTRVNEDMFYIAAKSLASMVSKDDLEHRCLYPPLKNIRAVSAKIAADVAEYCYEKNLATVLPKPKDLLAFCTSLQYTAEYPVYA